MRWPTNSMLDSPLGHIEFPFGSRLADCTRHAMVKKSSFIDCQQPCRVRCETRESAGNPANKTSLVPPSHERHATPIFGEVHDKQGASPAHRRRSPFLVKKAPYSATVRRNLS